MGKIKILIVDDEQTFTEMVKLNLEETRKFEVRTENKGTKALAAAREFNPDIILLDIIMPDMTGSEAAEKLKDDPFTKNIPIVFLTAVVTKEEEKKGNGIIGGNFCLAKPISVEELISFIENKVKLK